jgi:hypothetical protein
MTEKLKPMPLGIAAGTILGVFTLASGLWDNLSGPYFSWNYFPWHEISNAVISAVLGSIGGGAIAVLYNYLYDK